MDLFPEYTVYVELCYLDILFCSKLLKVNAILLEEIHTQEETSESSERKSVMEQLKLLFSELSFHNDIHDVKKQDQKQLQDQKLKFNSSVSCGLFNNNNTTSIVNGNVSGETDITEEKYCRDSGVEISLLEPDKGISITQSNIKTSTDDKNQNISADTTWIHDENDKLKSLLELESKKLSDAESKVLKLQERLSVVEEKSWKCSERHEVRIKVLSFFVGLTTAEINPYGLDLLLIPNIVCDESYKR